MLHEGASPQECPGEASGLGSHGSRGGARVRGWWPVPALLAAALLFAWLDTDSGLRTWWRLRQELRDATVRIESLREDVETRRRHAEALEGDAFAIERAIRERLQYARPGETIVRLRDTGRATPRIP